MLTKRKELMLKFSIKVCEKCKKCKLHDEEQTIVMNKERHTQAQNYTRVRSVRKPREQELVSPHYFREHFMSLISADTPQLETLKLADYNVYVPLLDKERSLEIVERSIKHLKHGKAAGADIE